MYCGREHLRWPLASMSELVPFLHEISVIHVICEKRNVSDQISVVLFAIAHQLTTFAWPTEYTSMTVNTMIAKRKVKLCDRSHKIHFNLAANINIRMDAIQMNAVKNSKNKINVRGKTATCNAVLSINNSKLQTSSPENAISMSL